MKHQLVLQFPGGPRADYNAVVALEDVLVTLLGEAAEVDGHYAAPDSINLFILTDDPAGSFAKLKPLLERREQLDWLTAASRPVEAEHYTVIWPPDWRKEFRIV